MRALPALFLLLTVSAGCGDNYDGGGSPDATPAGAMRVRATHYDVALDLATGASTTTVTLRVEAGGDCLTLPMRAELGAARLDGATARSATVTNDVLAVCGPGWAAGAELELAVDTTLTASTASGIQLGYTVSNDLEGQPYHQLISWVGGCDRFAPCDHAPDRFATYHFAVDHAEGVRVLCPGQLSPGATHSECAFGLPGGPTYSSFGLVAGPSWTEVSLGSAGAGVVEVVLYDMPSANFAAAYDAESVTGFLAWMAERFGPYPYGDQLRLIVAPTYWNGFEHPGNITLNDQLDQVGFPPPPYANPLHHTTFHEIAHQWAGDQTTLATTYDFVWKEAMAEYLTFVYEDEAIDSLVARRTARAWKRFAAGAAYHPVPGEKPALADYYGDVYGAGPLVLFRQLEGLFGRDAVLEALAALLGQERSLSVADVLAALEAATGAELDAYAEAWIYGEGAPTWPVFDVVVTPVEGGATVAISQAAADAGLYGCAFDIELRGDGKGETARASFDLGPDGQVEAMAEVDLAFAITDVVFDPDASCLATMASPAAAPATRVNPWVAP